MGEIPNLNNKILIDQYIIYGLNRRRSFLHLPKDNNAVTLPTQEDIEEFAKEILRSKECECALFFVHKDGTYSSVFKTVLSEKPSDDFDEDGNLVITYSIAKSPRKNDMHLFSWLDGEFRFCCYSILIEITDGLYESV